MITLSIISLNILFVFSVRDIKPGTWMTWIPLCWIKTQKGTIKQLQEINGEKEESLDHGLGHSELDTGVSQLLSLHYTNSCYHNSSVLMSIILDISLRLLFILTLVLSTLLLFEGTSTSQAQAGYLPEDEVAALHEIAKQLGKRDWDFRLNPCDGNNNWTTPQHEQYNNSIECNCSYDVCHVVSLYLKGQDLDGVLPPSLAKLPYIKSIDLTRNYLNGTIPSEWTSIKLEYLSVRVNRLSGRIPTFLGNITSLVYLNLESNMFFGTVPAELGKLKKLSILRLRANNLSGELPVELNSLTNLTEIRLSSNNFSGKIPSLESWEKLEKLEIQASGLEGPIHESISTLRNLKLIRISDVSGERSQFPDLSRITNLTWLMLRSCNLTGTIPRYISSMSKLKHLDLCFNNLNGDIPDLSKTSLQKMYLTGNSLNGSVPTWITDIVRGYSIDLSYNNFSEKTVPPTCPDSLNYFRSYSGGNNSELARCLSTRPCLTEYYSVNINCGGPEATIRNTLYEADVDSGGASKFVPLSDHWGFSSTGSVVNDSDGSVFEYVTTNVSVLTMNDYNLYTTARLSPLSLTYYGRCLANGNYTVTLRFAEIIIRDNRSYQSLGRRIFDIYVQGVNKFKDFDITNEAGGVDKPVIKAIKNINVSNRTLEIRFQYAGKGTVIVPHPGVYGPLISAISMEAEFRPPANSKKYTLAALGAVAAALCLGLIVIGIAWQRGYIGEQDSREKDLRGLDLKTGVFTYRQINAATDKFADSNKLGEGGFGAVYKGTLLDGTPIAVKKLSSKSRQGNREFVNEIGMIAGIQHPNVVRLHGCCVERNHLLLVYEYMENNSLARALFEHDKSKLEIDWPRRQRICVGVAKGLAFLHEESVLKMVHRDIKATNILLDADLTPKISDFGLAKLDEDENSHISTGVAGTMGYIAPEYALWGYLTYKADVYSFGVLALEIVTGKSNMKYQPNEDCFCLLDWAVDLKQKGSLMELVDPRLGFEFNKKEAFRMIKIALLCTNQSPTFRPTMSEVVNMLEGRTKINEPNTDESTSQDEFKFEELGATFEEVQCHDSGQTEILLESTCSNSKDLYPDSQISLNSTYSNSNDLYPVSKISEK
ncbi:hypothetical protein L2E82_47435 [Cichorium intybus]|uniref:Uncharacterized protein n=1 Tax=Cichorium intybus TaxID=13427 RepID=A0ACB8YVB6_CICIN|nr:hypothetical protein L2E82_47435 [Cichorium intybus]